MPHTPVSKRSVTLDALGAWVIKCNPRMTALDPMRAAGEAKPDWCLAGNYRSRLVRPGHRVLFWVAAHPQRGFWGAGHVTAEVRPKNGRLHVPVCIPLFTEPVTAAQLSLIAGLRTMEVFRSPQQANPSWVSKQQLAQLDPLLPSTEAPAEVIRDGRRG
jgi:hypothetical protein